MNQDEQLKAVQEELGSIRQKFESDSKASKVKTFNPLYATILVAIIGFVGTTIGTLINNRNSNALEARKFEFDIIKRGLEQPSQEERVKYLVFLSSLKLIKDNEINAALDSIVLNPETVPNLSLGVIKEVPFGSKPLEFNKDIIDSDARIGALKAARMEVGHLEDTSFHNGGPYVAKYMQGGQGFAWAAGFISWCYSQNLKHECPFKYSYSFEE